MQKRMVKVKVLFFSLLIILSDLVYGDNPRTTLNLNGIWEFEQTATAFPPAKFSRTIPVPGLVHLARPKIKDYEKLYSKSKTAQTKTDHLVLDTQYEPKYSWYRKVVKIEKALENTHAVLSIKKSKYVTQIYINGMDAGNSMECYTPIEFPVTNFIRYGQDNEILIRIGDRAWLPSPAAGSTDKEKVNYLAGIWDDIELSFTGALRCFKALVLPSVKESKVDVKLLIRDFYAAQQRYGDIMQDSCLVKVTLVEKSSGRIYEAPVEKAVVVNRDNITQTNLTITTDNPHLWSPDDPFLYVAKIGLFDTHGKPLDAVTKTFGIRDFERRGKYFYLNGQRCYLRGTNVTLHRFFEDPDCRDLPWNREWVGKLLGYFPKQLNWNAMRICVGIAPDFWYDIADSVGLMFQNEWLYWQDHGWDEQIRAEYSNWVWSDGSHPSIIIWDAINENWNEYVGNVLIPQLKELDPTRIWDAGYMTSREMALDEMDEPHPYMQPGWRSDFSEWVKEHPYPLGDLLYWPENWHVNFESSAAQLVNEYGWMWLWRNGLPSHLTKALYPYYVGENSTPEENWNMQAYWLQCQTEWLRVNRQLAGILAFCYLSDNLGFTGDWWKGDVAELNPSPALHWFKHCFTPTGVYIDVRDQRYIKMGAPYSPGSQLCFNLVGVTDRLSHVEGRVKVQLLDKSGTNVWDKVIDLILPACENKFIPICMDLPEKPGGYLILAEFVENGKKEPVLSRRYIKVGSAEEYSFYDVEIKSFDFD